MSTAVKYIVNGVASTFLSRALKSKTTYVVLAFVLAKAETLFEGTNYLNPTAWKETAIVGLGGAALIMIRSGQVKAELAAQALNQNLPVVAVESRKGGGPGLSAGLMAAVVAMLGLTGCDATRNLTDPDGNPVIVQPQPVCVETANGRVCYMPHSPGTAALLPPVPPAPAVPQLAK